MSDDDDLLRVENEILETEIRIQQLNRPSPLVGGCIIFFAFLAVLAIALAVAMAVSH